VKVDARVREQDVTGFDPIKIGTSEQFVRNLRATVSKAVYTIIMPGSHSKSPSFRCSLPVWVRSLPSKPALTSLSAHVIGIKKRVAWVQPARSTISSSERN